jgi:hypothetical protein
MAQVRLGDDISDRLLCSGRTVSQCIGQALSNGNGASLAFDVLGIGAGFLPGGGIVKSVGKVAVQTGLSLGSTAVSIAQHNNGEALISWGSATLPTAAVAAADISETAASAIPVLGTVVSAGELVYDGWQTGKAYLNCRSHP